MNRFKFVAMICCFVFVALAITPRLKADNLDKKTTMTFNEPFEVPGVGAQVLPAGTYIFKLLDSPADRCIVQISSEDGLHIYTTILAIPNYRLKATDKTVLAFKERGEGQPEAIKAWFYPGANWGQEFVYPKSRALELAKIVQEPVLAMPIEISQSEPAEEVETLKTVPVAAIQPTGEEVPVTAVVEAPPAEAAAPQAEVAPTPQADVAATPQATEVAETLPKTASSLPLFALIGLLSLIAGFTLLIVTKRSA